MKAVVVPEAWRDVDRWVNAAQDAESRAQVAAALQDPVCAAGYLRLSALALGRAAHCLMLASEELSRPVPPQVRRSIT